jgi:pyruvate ferredoxin oxidoreductase beta subunit
MIKKKEINKIPVEEYFAPGHRACAGCGPAIVARMMLKASGKDTIVVNATGCLEVASTPYPETSWRVPWIHGAFENASAIASGVETVLKKLNKKTNIIVLGGDGGTFDIGLQSLSGAAERGHNVCYICYDNGAYMNTGIQRSGATPKYAATTTTPAGKLIHGKTQNKKNMPFILASHGSYVATANIAFSQDFIDKIKKGLDYKGLAYIQIFAPCPTGWKYPGNLTIEIAKIAYQTKVTPLFEIENGVFKFTRKVASNKKIDDYLLMQGRFKHLSPKEISEIQKDIDDQYNQYVKLEESGLKIF